MVGQGQGEVLSSAERYEPHLEVVRVVITAKSVLGGGGVLATATHRAVPGPFRGAGAGCDIVLSD